MLYDFSERSRWVESVRDLAVNDEREGRFDRFRRRGSVHGHVLLSILVGGSRWCRFRFRSRSNFEPSVQGESEGDDSVGQRLGLGHPTLHGHDGSIARELVCPRKSD